MTAEFVCDIQSIAKQVAQQLGWQYQQPKDTTDTWQIKAWAYLSGPDNARLCLHVDTWKKRISVSGDYAGGMMAHAKDRPDTVTVSAERCPNAIAKDIQRRYLPAYLEAYARSVDINNKHVAHEKGCAALAIRLGKVCGEVPRSNNTIHYYQNDAPYFEARVDSPNSVKLDISNLSPELAEVIIKLVLKEKSNA